MSNSPGDPSPRPNLFLSIGRFVRRPSTLIVGGITLLGITSLGYFTTRYLVYERLTPILDNIFSEMLHRPVRVGKIEGFYFNRIRIGKSEIPATANSADSLSIDAIELGLNPLPLLLGLPLPIDVKLINPSIYLDQDKNGQWLDNLEKIASNFDREAPIKLNLGFQVEKAALTIQPYALKKPIEIKADGQGRFIDNQRQPLTYDFSAEILKSQVKIQGETALKTGESLTNLQIDRLNLSELLTLIPNRNFQLNQGQVNANIALNIPSWAKLNQIQGNGNFQVTEVAGKFHPFPYPIKLTTKLNLQGDKVLVEQANATIGKIKTEVRGEVNWQTGYHLNVALESVDLQQLLRIIYLQSPLDLRGEARSTFQVTGKLDQPLIKGTVSNSKPIIFEQIPIQSITSNFQTNLNRLNLDKIQIKPVAGGEIKGEGKLQLNILQSLQKNQPLDGTKMPINLNLQAHFPTRKILSQFATIPAKININDLQANIKARGSLGLPQLLINWQIPTVNQSGLINVAGEGKVFLGGNKINLTDTVIKTNGGKLQVNGNRDFTSKLVRAKITGNNFLLTPFVPLVCQYLDNICPYLETLEPLNLETANIQVSGQIDQLNINTLNGVANLEISSKQGTILVNSQVLQGNLQANAFLAGLPINSLLPNLPTQVKLVRSQINLQGYLGELINNKNNIFSSWQAQGNMQLLVDNNPLIATAKLNQGFMTGTVNTSGISLNPLVENLTVPVSLGRAKISFAGRINSLISGTLTDLQTWRGEGDIQLFVNNRSLKTTAQLEKGILSGIVNTAGINLNPFLPNINIPVSLGKTQVNFTSAINNLLAGKIPNLSTVNARVNTRLLVDNNPINTDIQLNNGIFNILSSLENFQTNIPLPLNISQTSFQAAGNAQTIFDSLQEKRLNLSSIKAVFNSRINVAKGEIKAKAQLNNNFWQSDIIAANLDPAAVLGQLPGIKSISIPNLDFRANLAGNIKEIWQGVTPIQVNNLSAQWGENSFDVRGNILLANLISQPDIAEVNLNLQAKTDLATVPLAEIISLLPIDPRLKPRESTMTGIGEFQGQITGKNLLTAWQKVGNIQIKGDINLANFSINDRPFEPILKGSMQAGIGQNISLNLRGNQDIIDLTFDPCQQNNCLLPYLPLGINIRQAFGNKTPFLATAKRSGENLNVQIADFPLEILKISPTAAYNVPGIIAGQVNANLDINLFNLQGQGQLEINRPSLGNLIGEKLTANLVYRDSIVQLQEGSLQAGASQYNLQGLFNWQTQEIEAKLRVDQGYIQDLLSVASIYDLTSLITLFSSENNPAIQLNPLEVGNPEASLAERVNLRAKIEEIIQQLARERGVVGIPSELDFRGRYQANIALTGTLKNPDLSVKFQGNRWEWRPQRPTVNIVNPLGIVTTDTQLIPIDEVTINLNLNRQLLRIEPIRLKSRDSSVFLAGDFSLKKVEGTFAVENLSLDLLRNFVQFPLDVSGSLKTQGQIAGTLLNPRIQGNFAFIDGAINAQNINQDIIGLFTYNQYRFDLRTTSSESIQIYASIPYPPLPGNDQLKIQAKLGTDAIKLIEAISQNAIEWVNGEGEVVLSAMGRLDIKEGLKIKDLEANGIVTLNNAAIRSVAFPEILTVNGRIGLTPESLTVEELQGSIAERQISVVGVLPFFQAIKNNPNPLTVNIQEGDIAINGLYRGLIAGNAMVTGTIQQPIIGGNVRLSRGKVFLPRTAEINQETDKPVSRWLQPLNIPQTTNITPVLNNFQVSLAGLSIEQEPLYQFDFSGALTLNGPLTPLEKLQTNGVINLDRGRVSYIDTRFLLNRRNQNVIVFDSSRGLGLFNPFVDIQLRTILSEFSQSRDFAISRPGGDFPSNEIPDDSLNRIQRIDVTLSVEGELNRLLPNLGRNLNEVCQIRPDSPPFPLEENYTDTELQKAANCLQAVAFARGEDEGLLNTPLVKLTSTPPRSQGEIIRLLGEQLLSVFNGLQGKNTEQLIQFGVVQLAIPLLAQGVVYDVENAVSNAIRATDFNILPNLETVYRVNSQSFIRFSYDYNLNEFTVRYQTQF
ncbi:MAG: hypothetical protein EWV49_17220 [Microcystis aeruginosa Ma_QC_Ch_20071001_S25]|uniref:Translocation and assembly module TamB C-terminal domain-containing protein n=1 Tax=Microcystis aeruginosa Ma_QC_Ch_20071001_S25D TaxID=2486250 RepID=A0A552FR93_MICAE|nr:MAG: hypothetical protein EWV49_17220 [Microcystis aeruginosa Ma_QC_Ch_20071001_S25]TRU49246.1 MAG: hypothetical protein EWV57_12625 [Microcystis aeruginosa Ma_QC_Ch_20071001_S25D]TRU67641.1 MAG: hypothetical protein EWV90_00230 [Microcystis aeruginosa Ma_QC_Ch_20071001_M135]